MQKRKIIIIASVLVLALSAFAILGIVLVVKQKSPRDAALYYARGEDSLKKGDKQGAYKQFGAAAAKNPNNVDYLAAAARAAAAIGKKEEATELGEKAWARGAKDSDLLKLIMAGSKDWSPTNTVRMLGEIATEKSRLPDEEKGPALAELLTMVDELDPEGKLAGFRGDLLYTFGKPREAIETWTAAFAKTSAPDLAVRLAKAKIAANDSDGAQKLLQEQREAGRLEEDGYRLYGLLSLLRDRLDEASSLYKEASGKLAVYGTILRFEHGLFELFRQHYPDARVVFEGLTEPTPDDAEMNDLRARARIFLGYIDIVENKRDHLKQLAELSAKAPSSPLIEGERAFYEAMMTTNVSTRLAHARRLVQRPNHPVIELVYAQQARRSGSPEEAAEVCRRVQGIMLKWPPLQLELAMALQQSRQEAQAMQVLQELHSRKIYSKESLSLYRDLALNNRQNDSARAAQEFLEKHFPQDKDVQMFGALSALQQGATQRAAEIFQSLSEKHPTEVRFKLGKVQVLAAENKYNEALEALRTIEGKPEVIATVEAVIYARLNRTNDAIASFEKAVQSDPPVGFYIEFANYLLRTGNYARAGEQFQAVLKKVPDHFESNFGMGIVAFQSQDWPAVVRHVEKAIEKNRESAAPHLLMASAQVQLKQFQKARDHCDAALLRAPNDQRARTLRASVLMQLGAVDEAEKDLNELLVARPEDPQILLQLSAIALQKRRFPEGLKLIDRVIAARPDDLSARLVRFQLLAASGDVNAASLYLTTLKTNLSAVDHDIRAALVARLRGSTNEAAALLEKHLATPAAAFEWARLRLDGPNPDSVVDRIGTNRFSVTEWVTLAQVVERSKNFKVAARLYENALKEQPDHPALLNNWAWNALQDNSADKAKILEACKKALAAMPRDPSVIDTYAEALLRSNRPLETRSLLTENISLTDRNPQLLWSLGRAYELSNEKENALRTYKTVLSAIERDPKTPVRFTKEEVTGGIQRLATQ